MTKVTSFDKLVRDKTPDLLAGKGIRAITRVAEPKEILGLLAKKLVEEAAEFERNPSLSELSDVDEVIEAIRMTMKLTQGEIRHARGLKNALHGRFMKRIVLIETVEE